MACPPAARCSSLVWRRASFLRHRPGWRRGRSLRIADSAILISASDDAIVVLTGTFMPLTGVKRGFAWLISQPGTYDIGIAMFAAVVGYSSATLQYTQA